MSPKEEGSIAGRALKTGRKGSIMMPPKEEGRSIVDLVKMNRRVSLGSAVLQQKPFSKNAAPTLEDLDHVRSLTENDFDLEGVLQAYTRSIQVPLSLKRQAAVLLLAQTRKIHRRRKEEQQKQRKLEEDSPTILLTSGESGLMAAKKMLGAATEESAPTTGRARGGDAISKRRRKSITLQLHAMDHKHGLADSGESFLLLSSISNEAFNQMVGSTEKSMGAE